MQNAKRRNDLSPFDSDQITSLRDLLQPDELFERLLPKLEQAVRDYPATQSEITSEKVKRRKLARAHVATAKRLHQGALRFVGILAKVRPSFDEGKSLGYLSDATSMTPPDLLFQQTQTCVSALAAEAGKWRDTAHIDSLETRGRKLGLRRHLASWVGTQLRAVGIDLKRSPSSRFARILMAVYEAAGVAVPEDLDRDIAHVLTRMRPLAAKPLHNSTK